MIDAYAALGEHDELDDDVVALSIMFLDARHTCDESLGSDDPHMISAWGGQA